MSEPLKSAASRPVFMLVCSAAVVLGTVGAWHFLEGPSTSTATFGAPPFVSPDSRTRAPAPVENGGETREQHRQYALAIERALVASDPQQRETAFAMLLPELLAADPAAAVQIMNRQVPGKTRDALRDEMARRWVMQDRESALTWMETLAEADRRAAARVAMHTLAAQSPEQAINAADRFGVGRDDGSVEYIVQIWAETDLESARRWAHRQSDDARNESLRARVDQVAARHEKNRP